MTMKIKKKNKDNRTVKEILEFNHKKQCGLWLMCIGAVLLISVAFGGKFLVNPFIFLAGYYACFFVVNVNKKVREKFSQGSISKFQIKMIYASVSALFVLMFGIAGPFIPGWHWRQIWLGVMLATAIHFLIWFVIHGKSMIVLGIVCMVIVAVGYIFTGIPLWAVCIADAAAKIICGVYMFFAAEPTKYVPKALRQG